MWMKVLSMPICFVGPVQEASDASVDHKERRGRGGIQGSKPAMEVFDQGTYKTELCNKWEELGTCPYGPRCQVSCQIIHDRAMSK